jgi:hypothetical protein
LESSTTKSTSEPFRAEVSIQNPRVSDWVSDISRHTEEFDYKIRAFVKARPGLVALGALGIGLLTSIIVGKFSERMSSFERGPV